MPKEQRFRARFFTVSAARTINNKIQNLDVEVFQKAINRARTEIGIREKKVYGKYHRLENSGEQDGYVLLNFITLNFPGPGRAALGTPAQPIGLSPEEEFSYETAVLYHPDSAMLFAEAAQGGVGPSAIARYFGKIAGDRTTFILTPLTDLNAPARAQLHEEIRSVGMRVAIGPASKHDRQEGLAAATAFARTFGQGYMDIEIKVRPQQAKTLSIKKVRKFVKQFTSRSRPPIPLEKLRTKGRINEGDPLEVIDLFQHREWRECDLPVDDGQRSVPYKARWGALMDFHKQFVT